MIPAEPLPNEEERLAAVFRQKILDTPNEQDFDDLVALAAQLCGSEIALISIVDDCRQWFKAKVGVDADETPKDIAFCAHAIHGEDIFEIPDALEDERFFDNPLVTGEPHLRFYAGQPINSVDGHKLGTLCVIDRSPRQLDDSQRQSLKILARQVEKQLELQYRVFAMERGMEVIQSQTEELSKLNRLKDQLLMVLSHDLRTPLASLEGILDCFKVDGMTGADVVELVPEITPQLNKAKDQISQVLDWAQVELRQQSVSMGPFSAAAIAHQSLQWVKTQAEKKQIYLVSDIHESLWAHGNEEFTELVLRNLLVNAIKYSRRGCEVKLCTEIDSDDRIGFYVKDDGLGMRPETVKQLLDINHVASKPGTEKELGCGLGLMLCQTYLSKMGTKLSIESLWKEGSTFGFQLAIANSPSLTQEPSSIGTDNS